VLPHIYFLLCAKKNWEDHMTLRILLVARGRCAVFTIVRKIVFPYNKVDKVDIITVLAEAYC
jgi:hypothetical protein